MAILTLRQDDPTPDRPARGDATRRHGASFAQCNWDASGICHNRDSLSAGVCGEQQDLAAKVLGGADRKIEIHHYQTVVCGPCEGRLAARHVSHQSGAHVGSPANSSTAGPLISRVRPRNARDGVLTPKFRAHEAEKEPSKRVLAIDHQLHPGDFS
jgi:hypothetical protein